MRSVWTPASAPWNFTAKTFSLRTNSTPNTGTSESTAISAMMVAASPASPNLRIRSESENCSAMNDMPAVPWVSTQAGPTTSTAFLNAVYLSWPAISRSRAAKVSCIESEKLITMISGVITFKNMLRLKLAHPSAAERQHDRDDRREGGDDHERYLAEEDDRDDAAGQNAEDVVGQPVALHRVADFELHHRNAG